MQIVFVEHGGLLLIIIIIYYSKAEKGDCLQIAAEIESVLGYTLIFVYILGWWDLLRFLIWHREERCYFFRGGCVWEFIIWVFRVVW